MLEVAPPLLRWYERERERLGVDVFDVHTHVGQHDPDTMRCSPEELLAALAQADARACVFPLQEPDGYRAANDAVIAAAQASGGRLVPFARLRPSDGRTEIEAELRRALDAGSRGVKLHPRGDSHALDDRALDGVWALAHERRLPVIVHAGRGIPALGAHAVAVCTRWPGVRLILAHAAISDLSWIGRRAQELPNLLFDTSWWAPSDLLALFATVPPGQVLLASDAPYGRIPTAALQTLRAGRQAGLSDEQLRLVLGGQLARLLAGEELLDAGPAAGGDRRIAVDVLLDRVASFLTGAFAQIVRGQSGDEMVALAQLACAVPADAPQAAHCRLILELLDVAEQLADAPSPSRILRGGLYALVLALNVARTPDVAVPAAL
ncbi:MAG TPA: amidohydrolase family protein [Conexibacter sp.]|nr:amidohydrolase family protein [Conexibacter sp.]